MVKYLSPNHRVVIQYHGGRRAHDLLTTLGFKSEIAVEYEFKRKVKQAKLRDFVQKHKAKKQTDHLDLWATAKEALV